MVVSGTTLVRPGVSNLGAGALTVVTRGVTTPTFTYRPVAATANQPQVIRVQPGEYCGVLKGAGSQSLVSVCQHIPAGSAAARLFTGWQQSSALLWDFS